jgi:hypothetical protein
MNYPITILCRCIRVSKSGYYYWKTTPQSPRSRQNDKINKTKAGNTLIEIIILKLMRMVISLKEGGIGFKRKQQEILKKAQTFFEAQSH